jgi:hypothetical protein
MAKKSKGFRARAEIRIQISGQPEFWKALIGIGVILISLWLSTRLDGPPDVLEVIQLL